MTVRVVATLFLFFLLSTLAFGQTQITTGVIQGTVTDPSGAVVPGAEVSIKNLDTNFTKTLATDNDGRFVAALMPPGRYKITVTKTGFANLTQENVVLTVAQTASLSLPMRVPGGEQTVIVRATPTLDLARVESSTTLNQT